MIALFGRVGGGIYTKAADVGADLAGKVVKGLPEDDIRNPGVIADNVGDNVGDIAGMGSDLFGSLAESTCAALVVSGTSEVLVTTNAYYYPLLITAAGILVSIVTYLLVYCPCFRIIKFSDVEKAIKWQIIISTVLMIPMLALFTVVGLPEEFSLPRMADPVSKWEGFACAVTGLIAGFLIGMVTEYGECVNNFSAIAVASDGKGSAH